MPEGHRDPPYRLGVPSHIVGPFFSESASQAIDFSSQETHSHVHRILQVQAAHRSDPRGVEALSDQLEHGYLGDREFSVPNSSALPGRVRVDLGRGLPLKLQEDFPGESPQDLRAQPALRDGQPPGSVLLAYRRYLREVRNLLFEGSFDDSQAECLLVILAYEQ